MHKLIGAGIALESHILVSIGLRTPSFTHSTCYCALRADRQYFSDVMAVYEGAHEYDRPLPVNGDKLD